jgi:hypothetical protein
MFHTRQLAEWQTAVYAYRLRKLGGELMAKELAQVLAVALGIPLAIIGYLIAVFSTLGAMALLGAMITLDLGILIGIGVIIARHNRGN